MATKPTVFIETSVVGHLTTRLPKDPVVAGRILETRRWWESTSQHFECFTSELVLAEAADGDPTAAAERLNFLSNLALLPVPEDAVELAELLLQRHALPAKARVDASHLATTAVNGIAFLLTWNCKHLANATLRATIETTCREFGFEAPIICTPTELSEVPP
jgi:hypothetical protein